MPYFFLALISLCHLLILNTQIDGLKESPSKGVNKEKIRSTPIKVEIVKTKAAKESVLSGQEVKKTGISWELLKQAIPTIQDSTKFSDPNDDSKSDPGGLKRKCFEDIIASAVNFPPVAFDNRIAGEVSLRVKVLRNSIIIDEERGSHPILTNFFCYDLKNQFTKSSESQCLAQKEIRGVYKIKSRYTYGQRPVYNFKRAGPRSYFIHQQRIKKEAPIRFFMAIANIFSLLELYRSSEDRAIDKSKLITLSKLECTNLKIDLKY